MQIKRERTYQVRTNTVSIDHVGSFSVQWALVDEMVTPIINGAFKATSNEPSQAELAWGPMVQQPADVQAAVATIMAWAQAQAGQQATGEFAAVDSKIAEAEQLEAQPSK